MFHAVSDYLTVVAISSSYDVLLDMQEELTGLLNITLPVTAGADGRLWFAYFANGLERKLIADWVFKHRHQGYNVTLDLLDTK